MTIALGLAFLGLSIGDHELSPACQFAIWRIERTQPVPEGQGGSPLRQAAIIATINGVDEMVRRGTQLVPR